MPLGAEREHGCYPSSMWWLSHGLTTGEWSYPNSEHPLPRRKTQDPNKGDMIDFSCMRTLQDVAGFKAFETFLRAKAEDMQVAEQAGQRMPLYLKRGLSFSQDEDKAMV